VADQLSPQVAQVEAIAEALEGGGVIVDDDNDEDQGVQQVLQHGQVARQYGGQLGVEVGDQGCGDDRAVDVTHAAQHHHDQDLNGVVVAELGALHGIVTVAVEHTGNTGEGSRDNEGQKLIFGDVDTRGAGRDLIVSDSGNGTTVLGADEILHHGQGDQHQHKGDDEEILLVKSRGTQTQRTAEAIAGGILENGFDDFAKGQSDDGQVVAAQTQSGDTDDDTADGGHGGTHQEGNKEGQNTVAQGGDQKRGHFTAEVRADAHESGVTQGKLTKEAYHQGKRHRKDNADGHLFQQEQGRAVNAAAGHGDDGQHDGEDTDGDIVDIMSGLELFEKRFHTFSLRFLPRKPVGLTNRIMIRMENSMASV